MKRLYQPQLQYEARARCNEEQRTVFDNLINTGFKVGKLLWNDHRAAVAFYHDASDTIGWLTHDGKFHRPIKGKSSVSINRHTLERIW